jgi:hypothetical protein
VRAGFRSLAAGFSGRLAFGRFAFGASGFGGGVRAGWAAAFFLAGVGMGRGAAFFLEVTEVFCRRFGFGTARVRRGAVRLGVRLALATGFRPVRRTGLDRFAAGFGRARRAFWAPRAAAGRFVPDCFLCLTFFFAAMAISVPRVDPGALTSGYFVAYRFPQGDILGPSKPKFDITVHAGTGQQQWAMQTT